MYTAPQVVPSIRCTATCLVGGTESVEKKFMLPVPAGEDDILTLARAHVRAFELVTFETRQRGDEGKVHVRHVAMHLS